MVKKCGVLLACTVCDRLCKVCWVVAAERYTHKVVITLSFECLFKSHLTHYHILHERNPVSDCVIIRSKFRFRHWKSVECVTLSLTATSGVDTLSVVLGEYDVIEINNPELYNGLEKYYQYYLNKGMKQGDIKIKLLDNNICDIFML